MSRNYVDPRDDHLVSFSINNPPPPYYGLQVNPYNLTPIPFDQNRPRLPEARRNPLLNDLPEDANIVKFQTIVREDTEIVVGRVKVPTPGAQTHAFILRRYDTHSVSLTTMFKVAFPGATEEEEKTEMEWVKASFDTRECNGGRDSSIVKLAGVWVPRHLAISLSAAYGITDLISALSRASPDPNVIYRKSQRSQAAAEEMARNRLAPSMTENSTPAPKRTRRQSPEVPTEDRVVTVEATTTVTAPAGAEVDVNSEIEQAKQLVLDLKREIRLKAAAGESLEEQGFAVGESSRGIKRSSDADDGVSLSSTVGGKRVIARSKRVEASLAQSTTARVAWSAALFGLGAAATYLFPQVLGSFF